ARARFDGALAERIERDGIESFVDDWQALPLFASHRRLSDAARFALRRQRLRNQPVGLANSLRGFGQGVQPYLGDRLCELAMPVCVIAGDEDEKYRRLAGEMAARIAGAEVAIVVNCGHTPHLEQPEQFDTIVTGFLERMQPVGERMETT
ncbi:MAG: alpha/beta fold hydrolase, partial [Thermomicrobiales bacterium]|nr:alpha/beta fold hydrolase [Thermomicrobiales bacterium]